MNCCLVAGEHCSSSMGMLSYIIKSVRSGECNVVDIVAASVRDVMPNLLYAGTHLLQSSAFLSTRHALRTRRNSSSI